MANNELDPAPCPHCGVSMRGDAEFMDHPTNDCFLSEWEFSQPDIAAWNRRAAPAQGAITDAEIWKIAPKHSTASDGIDPISFARAIEQRIRGQVSDAADAARWRAFVGSARIKMQGSAGLNKPLPNNYAHMGLEIWTTFDRDYPQHLLDQMDKGNALGREWLTKYADIAVAAIQAQAGEGEKA